MSDERSAQDSLLGPEQDQNEPADEIIDVGQRLRLAREARGLSVGEVATALKLSPHQVVALEADDWFRFPRTVTRGFVRNYARYLKLDAAPLMTALDQVPMPHGSDLAVSAGASVDMPREGKNSRRDYVPVVAGLMALMLALAAYFFVPIERWQSGLESIKAFVLQKEAPPPEAVEPIGTADDVVAVLTESTLPASPSLPSLPVPVPAEMVPAAPTVAETVAPPPVSVEAIPAEAAPVEVVSVEAVSVEVAPVEVAPVETDPVPLAAENTAEPPLTGALVFSFAQPSWVEVRDRDGQVILSQIHPAGSQRGLDGQAPFTLVVGNASHVRLQYKGKPVELAPRSKGDVARLTLE